MQTLLCLGSRSCIPVHPREEGAEAGRASRVCPRPFGVRGGLLMLVGAALPGAGVRPFLLVSGVKRVPSPLQAETQRT